MATQMVMRDGKWGAEEIEVITPCNANYMAPAPVEDVPVRTGKIVKKQLTDNLKIKERKQKK